MCNCMRTYIMNNDVGWKESQMLLHLMGVIELIYCLSSEESSIYVTDFFLLRKWDQFEKPVRLFNAYFGHL